MGDNTTTLLGLQGGRQNSHAVRSVGETELIRCQQCRDRDKSTILSGMQEDRTAILLRIQVQKKNSTERLLHACQPGKPSRTHFPGPAR